MPYIYSRYQLEGGTNENKKLEEGDWGGPSLKTSRNAVEVEKDG